VVLGVHTGATVSLPWHTLFMREASVVPSLGYCAHDGRPEMVDVADMLAEDPEIARAVITHRFPLEDATEAFRVAADRSSGAIRVVLEP
jgi:threonine dehydrogenase-like Zn-dependent dehydrogenase